MRGALGVSSRTLPRAESLTRSRRRCSPPQLSLQIVKCSANCKITASVNGFLKTEHFLLYIDSCFCTHTQQIYRSFLTLNAMGRACCSCTAWSLHIATVGCSAPSCYLSVSARKTTPQTQIVETMKWLSIGYLHTSASTLGFC